MHHVIHIDPAGRGYRAAYRGKDLGVLLTNPMVEAARILLAEGAKKSDSLAMIGACPTMTPMALGVLAEPRTPPPIRVWRGARERVNEGFADSQSLWHERSAIQ